MYEKSDANICHCLFQEQYLLNIIIEQMVVDSDPEMGGAVQLMGILRILIDPENMMATVTKSERADFLAFFYKHSMHYLVGKFYMFTVFSFIIFNNYFLFLFLLSFLVSCFLLFIILCFCFPYYYYYYFF